jgi:hypothetical protein
MMAVLFLHRLVKREVERYQRLQKVLVVMGKTHSFDSGTEHIVQISTGEKRLPPDMYTRH